MGNRELGDERSNTDAQEDLSSRPEDLASWEESIYDLFDGYLKEGDIDPQLALRIRDRVLYVLREEIGDQESSGFMNLNQSLT